MLNVDNTKRGDPCKYVFGLSCINSAEAQTNSLMI